MVTLWQSSQPECVRRGPRHWTHSQVLPWPCHSLSPFLTCRVPGEESGPHLNSPRMQQRAVLGPVPLTRTSRTRTLRDQEDEIFKL